MNEWMNGWWCIYVCDERSSVWPDKTGHFCVLFLWWMCFEKYIGEIKKMLKTNGNIYRDLFLSL